MLFEVTVHLQSGTKLGSTTVQAQGQAHVWLERVLQLTGWNRSARMSGADPAHSLLRVEIARLG
jgi:hypothetical protein